MNRKTKKIIAVAVVLVLVITGAVGIHSVKEKKAEEARIIAEQQAEEKAAEEKAEKEKAAKEKAAKEKAEREAAEKEAAEREAAEREKQQNNGKEASDEQTRVDNGTVKATYVKGILVVNKKHPVPAGFASGEDPEAGRQVRKLIRDMQNKGFAISDRYSGFRTHEYQMGLYNNYVANEGKKAADTYSARPGYSEHETGLAFDIIDSSGQLVTASKPAKWIKNNAHKYGFIVRYPYGKDSVTGYMPEPWHLRYVGSYAEDIYNSGLTLEEYLNVEGGGYRN